MSAERIITSGDQAAEQAEFLQAAASKLGLPENHPAVTEHAALLKELADKDDHIRYLKIELEKASKDPLTGAWNRGPGFARLEKLISIVENAPLIGDKDTPNTIVGIGLDVEGLHYTNNFFGQAGGDTRLVQASRELREAAGIVADSLRTRSAADRRFEPREENQGRYDDLLIRTGGDELMAALAVTLTDDNTQDDMSKKLIARLSERKNMTAPGLDIMYKIGFYVAGSGMTAEDFYHSVDPKADMGRVEQLLRPARKLGRFVMGSYKPAVIGQL